MKEDRNPFLNHNQADNKQWGGGVSICMPCARRMDQKDNVNNRE